ncbi:response regulator transcription factor [Biformimicrobium ophioploci]|uniref:Response regulator transcription factor n=1 Tax=Biformimicrobium ophioploci TaxID=3036711 RepID=A0ABQ6LYE4_9GAMM|nr:response regulator [Microbulbifer sp. NKW57]GMG87123.1 response regulator transcription factor [Microbulbifer sp. NKW57]
MPELSMPELSMPEPRCLLVDDDETALRLMKRALERQGFAIADAASVEAALALIAQQDFDCALLDLKIGNDSGLHLIEPLRARNPHARILMLTGYSSVSTAVAAIKLGANDYLCKPATGEAVAAALAGQPAAEAEEALVQTPLPDNPPSVGRVEWEHIQRVLAENEGNISATARALGMHRRTLQRKLQKRPVKQ